MEKRNFMTRWTIANLNGYQPKTTFWSDFCIAEAYGADAIKDTYNRTFNEWKTNVEYLTELVLVLNHKIWYWYDVSRKNHEDLLADEYSRLYDELWRTADEWCGDNLKGSDAEYYYSTTD